MTLLDSLLAAIVRGDGDALVMHSGEKPYVIAPTARVELSNRPLSAEAMSGMLAELLPPDEERALAEDGAIEHGLASDPEGDRFTLVAARGGDDVWVEIRRYRQPGAETSTEPPPEPKLAAGSLPGAPGPELAPAGEPQPAVVLSMSRAPLRSDPAVAGVTAACSGVLDRLLRLAAARNATTLYIIADSRPLLRVDGEIAVVETEPALSLSDVETMVLEMAPEPTRDALRSGAGTEWVVDVPDVGSVRCVSFGDHKGPGAIFRLIPGRALSADQLGLSREIQALCTHLDGLIVVTGRRGSGKSTLLSAFVDIVNRTRSDHVITLESRIQTVHESRRALISQREVRGYAHEVAEAARAALREDPDVLVIEELGAPDVVSVALKAAEGGRLVMAAITAPSAADALERVIDRFDSGRRPAVQRALARLLRGVVAQVLLRKTGGGRLAARELLLNVPPVTSLIDEGKMFQLPLAIESGRRHGMVPLNDALAAFVQSGATEAREAYRKAVDRDGLLNLLKRAGVDTSFVERLA
ncbi:MAG: Flp pilus assembly complex ATPase component TadA [Acidobacteria bacterium]|nr:Flp pilus assembly complex ATPase component TadA [Acidobacteriota bacterium]